MRVYFTFGKSPVEVHCAAVSTCIVGVRDGCRLRARRVFAYCFAVSITDVIIVKDSKISS